MTHTLTFDPSGKASTIGTDAIPLHALGRLAVQRVSNIEFDEVCQVWGVHIPPNNPYPLYCDPSRQKCLKWEHSHFEKNPDHLYYLSH